LLRSRERGIPMVLGVLEATGRIPDGAQVAVDGVAGIVRWMA
jgi:phosphohistidine swiveling domain-containing protein